MSQAFDPRYPEFLRRLRSARLSAGLSQANTAELLQRPQSFVSKCESGTRRVDVVELAVFAKLYRKPVTYFLHD